MVKSSEAPLIALSLTVENRLGVMIIPTANEKPNTQDVLYPAQAARFKIALFYHFAVVIKIESIHN